MRQVLVWTLLTAATGLCVWTAASPRPSAPEPCTPAASCKPQASCKPEAPIAVTLVPDAATSGVVRAAFGIRPVLALSDVRWSWELSPDVRLVEGDAAGAAAGERGALTEREVAFSLPNDGRHHEAKLIVSGQLLRQEPVAGDADADAEPETVMVLRTLSWGEPEPATPVVWSPDAETGTLVEVAVVPTTHVPAPQGRAGGR